MLNIREKKSFIHYESRDAARKVSFEVEHLIREALSKGYKNIVFLCIGTDRSTGDSLGPLIGNRLKYMQFKKVHILGDLENPVHAKNLYDVLEKVHHTLEKPFIVAIDACLGKIENVGIITIGEGSIKPGAGLNKQLQKVGDMYITGIVNFGGFMDFVVLQNTRLNTVVKISEIISSAIEMVMSKLCDEDL